MSFNVVANSTTGFGITLGGGVTNYTLTCNAGAYSLTGQSSTLLRTKSLTANAGSYTYTGIFSGLLRGKRIVANAGSYTLTGQSADLTYTPLATNYVLTCLNGAYTYAGVNSSLIKTKRIVANAGAYTYTGITSGLRKGKGITANAGAYSLTGIDATLTKTTLNAYVLTCLTGSYSLTGQQATLTSSSAPIITPQVQGGISKSRIVVVEVDGAEYRVPQNKLQSFLYSIPKKAEEKKAQRKKAPTERFKPVEIEIKSAPIQFIEKLQTEPIYASLKANKLFLQAAIRYQQELDDEEAILLLM